VAGKHLTNVLNGFLVPRKIVSAMQVHNALSKNAACVGVLKYA
jgi:hypothetical protein